MKQPLFIVGAGPIGLIFALELSRHNIPVRIFEKEPYRHEESRALSLQPATVEVFQKLGLLDEIIERGKRIYHLKVYAENEMALDLDFSKLKVPNPFIALLPQKDIEDILINRLLTYDVEIERQTKLLNLTKVAEGIEVEIENDRGKKEKLFTPYLIGCDGAKSQVRKLLNIEFNRTGKPHHYLLADAVIFWERKPDAYRIFLNEKGLVTIIPIRDNRYRIICDLKEEKVAHEISPSFFKQKVKERLSGRIEIEDLIWIGEYKRSYRQAEHFRRGRCFLVGDAAHVHSPIESQGINQGIHDAFNLAWKIAYVSKGIASKNLLKSYAKERKPIIKRIITKSHSLLNLSSETSIWKEQYRNYILRLYQKTPILKLMVTYDLAGIAAHYKKSPIVKSQFRWLFFNPAIVAGCRLFDGKLQNPKTRVEIRTFSLIQSPKHQLFLFFKKGDALKALNLKEELNHRYEQILGIHLICSEECTNLEHYWIDLNQTMGSPFKLFYPFMVLVRPDQHIGLTSRRLKKKKIEHYFEGLLGISV